MKKNIFIDGEVGTTGLQVHEKLSQHPNVNILPVDYSKRKDPSYKKEMLEASDVTFLCLPDDSAIETAKIADKLHDKSPIIIDASTAHRVDRSWVYGFPELTATQRTMIATASRIRNPGCYPTAFLALIKPLIAIGVLPKYSQIIVPDVSG